MYKDREKFNEAMKKVMKNKYDSLSEDQKKELILKHSLNYIKKLTPEKRERYFQKLQKKDTERYNEYMERYNQLINEQIHQY